MNEETTEKPKTAVDELAELERQEAEERKASAAAKAEEAARIELANRRIIKQLREKNPGRVIVRVDTEVAGMIVVRGVTYEQFEHFKRAQLDATAGKAHEILAAAGVIYPDPDTWETLGKEHPALLYSIAERVIEAS